MQFIRPLKVLLLLGFFKSCFISLNAQNIKGVLKDSANGKPVVYATMHLYNKGETVVNSSYSNESGAFSLSYTSGLSDTLTLIISALGFKEKRVTILPDLRTGRNTEMIIDLAASDKSLENVTVLSTRRVIEIRPGMIVYHAANDVTNKGGTAADILRKAPVLNVDGQGNVSLRGSSNLKILINGKYSGQIARSPADALNMMPADLVKSVEVITTPSARYDAEGAAGVVNIITKKNRSNFNGNLEIAAGNLEQVINPRIAATSEKLNFSIHGHLHRLRYKTAKRMDRISPASQDRLKQNVQSNNAAPHGSADVSIIYSANSQTELSLGANTWFGQWPGNATITTHQYDATGKPQAAYRQILGRKENYFGSDIYLGLDHQFKKANRSLNILSQFTPSHSNEPYNFALYDQSSLPYYQEINNNRVLNREWTIQVDYLHPFNEKGQYILETGTKAVARTAMNDYQVTTQSGSELPQPDVNRTDVFNYRQSIWAVYAILKSKWEHNWYAEGGLRYESTNIKGQFTHQPQRIRNHFGNLIPSFNITKKINEFHMTGLNYTVRITRPYIWDLNPNANASDPKNIETGNPDLNPEIMQQAEFTYGLQASSGWFVNTAVFWKRTHNAIIDFTEIGTDGVGVTRKENMASNVVYGFNLSTSIRPSSSWSTNGNFNLNYLNYTQGLWQFFNRGWAVDVNLNSTLKLPYQMAIQAFGEYTSRKVTLQGFETSRYYYTFALQKEITQPRLTLTFMTANPFTKYITQTHHITTPTFLSNALNHSYLRSFRVTLSWEFGQGSTQKVIKKVKNDDVNIQGKE